MTGERSAPTQETISFGPFELSSGERILRRDGLVLPLGGRALDILIYLVGRPGEVVTKKELIDHAWPNVVVEEGSLRVHIAAIRKALPLHHEHQRQGILLCGAGFSLGRREPTR